MDRKQTAAYLQEVEQRVNNATAGPWEIEESHGRDCIWLDVISSSTEEILFNGETQMQPHIVHPDYQHQCAAGKEKVRADLEFIAHARTDVPRLLEIVRELLQTEMTN